MPPGWAIVAIRLNPSSSLRRVSTDSASAKAGTMSLGTSPNPPSASVRGRSICQNPVSIVMGRSFCPLSSSRNDSARYSRYGRPSWVKVIIWPKGVFSCSLYQMVPVPSQVPRSHEKGTSSGVKLLGISIAIHTSLTVCGHTLPCEAANFPTGITAPDVYVSRSKTHPV